MVIFGESYIRSWIMLCERRERSECHWVLGGECYNPDLIIVSGNKGAGLAQYASSDCGPYEPLPFLCPIIRNSASKVSTFLSRRLWEEVSTGVRELEAATGEVYGDVKSPLLIAVRARWPLRRLGWWTPC